MNKSKFHITGEVVDCERNVFVYAISRQSVQNFNQNYRSYLVETHSALRRSKTLFCVNLILFLNMSKKMHVKKKTAHYAQNSHHNHHSRQSKLSVKAGSNICLGLSSPTNLPAYDRYPWNQIQLISPLNCTLWLSEERDAITQITVLTQVALISCLRGMHHDRIMIALKQT